MREFSRSVVDKINSRVSESAIMVWEWWLKERELGHLPRKRWVFELEEIGDRLEKKYLSAEREEASCGEERMRRIEARIGVK
jgi:hypothetical protein